MVSSPRREAASTNSAAPFCIETPCYYNRKLITPNSRNILVTGGTGYIGSHTVRLLLDQGHDVTVVDNLSKGHRYNVPADRLHVIDLADTAALTRLMQEKRCDAVIHFA